MFCQKCGSELPDGTKFCSQCGTEHSSVEVQNKQNTTATEKKKTNKIVLSLAVVAIAGLFGKFVIAPMMTDGDSGNEGTQTANNLSSGITTTDSSSGSADSGYAEVFSSRHIVESPAMLFGLDSAAFAKVDTDGMIEKMEFGYKDDIVNKMICTLYIPTSDLSDEQKSGLDAGMKEEYSKYEAEDFCSVKYNIGSNFYTVTIDFDGLEDADNVKKLAEFGFLTDYGASAVSMSQTENDLISNGFVKK